MFAKANSSSNHTIRITYINFFIFNIDRVPIKNQIMP